MMIAEHDKKAAATAGWRSLRFLAVAVALGVLWLAYATEGFTKKPSWFELGIEHATPAITKPA